MKKLFLVMTVCLLAIGGQAQTYNQIDENGTIIQRDEFGNQTTNRNFNKHNNDTIRHKEIPKGIYVWTVDRKFGDIIPAKVDTVHHLFMNTIFNTGLHGEFNSIGNNYSARQNRVFIDRPETDPFIFTQPYDYVYLAPDQLHFTNTLSPLTNLTYDNCGNKQNGEDHIRGKFAVNVNKRLGLGFDLNYSYARGYYANQNTSHFGATLFGSYRGDHYQLHAMFSAYHQKTAESGGITDDNYVLHPEMIGESYTEDEIPTVLSRTWNRNNHQHFFLTHRYSLGFYRKVKMTDEELKARAFAKASKKEKEEREQLQQQGEDALRQDNWKRKNDKPLGRPKDAKIMGDEPVAEKKKTEGDERIKVENDQQRDSLLAAQALQDSIEATMKREYVPVTSFIHTMEVNNYDRIFLAYESPENYYANTYFNMGKGNLNDSIYDPTRHPQMKNTFAVALMEGFNKYVKAGLKVFFTHDYRRYKMYDLEEDEDGNYVPYQRKWTEHNVSIGGLLSKRLGKTFHFSLMAETWLTGKESGQLKFDFNTDVNFKLFGDTLQLAAHAYFHRLKPTFYQRNYHSKHAWWDREDELSAETRARIEGIFTYQKTKTRLRLGIEHIKNHLYFGMNSTYVGGYTGMTDMSLDIYQKSGSISVLTAQLEQRVRWGILNWENVITVQNSSDKDVLPLPTLNIWTNLFLKFSIAKVLKVELGADMTWFSKYKAPFFSPQLNQYVIQKNEEAKVELGNYPFINVYANFHLKHARFFVMMSHVNAKSGNRNYFLAPHYPQNLAVLRLGVSWNFFN